MHLQSNILTSDLFLIPCDPHGCCSASSYVFMCVIKAACIGCTSHPLLRCLSACWGERACCLCSVFAPLRCWGLPPAWWDQGRFPWTYYALAPGGFSCLWGGRPPWTPQCRCCHPGCCRWWWPGQRWLRLWSPSLGRRSATSMSAWSPPGWWNLRRRSKG